MLGLADGTVEIVEYHAAWATAAAGEAARIQSLLPGVRIEHIGSTAVPGLCAKPLLDLMVGVDDSRDTAQYSESLKQLGYLYFGEYGIAGREFFVRYGGAGIRTHHVHLVPHTSEFWRSHLAFRDRLLQDTALQASYAGLKRDLASTHAYDRPRYTAAKSAFIASILGQPFPGPDTL